MCKHQDLVVAKTNKIKTQNIISICQLFYVDSR